MRLRQRLYLGFDGVQISLCCGVDRVADAVELVSRQWSLPLPAPVRVRDDVQRTS